MTLWLTVAAVGAGVLGGPWGAAPRAAVRAPVAATGPIRPGPVGPPDPGNTAGTASRGAGSAAVGSAQAAVDAAVPRLIAGRPANSVSLVGIDETTGVSVGWGANTVMPAASVFKLTLLESCLLLDQERGEPAGGGASDVLTTMIENSDNDAADEVYEALGGRVGVTARMHELGMSSTVLGSRDQWGLSTTSAEDQSRLLTNLVAPASPLTAASRAYALGLMTNVEPDQRWGVGAAADPGTGFANKNGWLDVDDDGGRWVVSSVGLIEVGGHQVLLAALTQHDADLDDGLHLVQALSRTVASALRGTTTTSG